MQASKKIPFDDPNVLLGVRALYLLSNLAIIAIYFYVGMQIDKKKGMPPSAAITCVFVDADSSSPQTAPSSNTSNPLLWVAPKSQRPSPPPSTPTTSNN